MDLWFLINNAQWHLSNTVVHPKLFDVPKRRTRDPFSSKELQELGHSRPSESCLVLSKHGPPGGDCAFLPVSTFFGAGRSEERFRETEKPSLKGGGVFQLTLEDGQVSPSEERWTCVSRLSG